MIDAVAPEPTKPLTSTLKVQMPKVPEELTDLKNKQRSTEDPARLRERRFPERIYASDWRTVQSRLPGQGNYC
jgi:hypothetical protein